MEIKRFLKCISAIRKYGAGGGEITTLATGSTINTALNKSATQFMRSTTSPAAGITATDISEAQDGSIVTWYDEANTTQYWYTRCKKILMNSDSSNVFLNCTALTSLDISNFDASNVTNMSGMFNGCTALSNIIYGDNFVNTKLSSIDDTSSINGSYNMYLNCPANKPTWTGGTWNAEGTFVKTILMLATGSVVNAAINPTAKAFVITDAAPEASVSTTDVSNDNDNSIVTWYDSVSETQYLYANDTEIYMNPDSSLMFNWNSSNRYLASIDLHKFNASKVTTMKNMFFNCTVLTSLDLSKWNTSNVTDMSGTFECCYALQSLLLPKSFMSNTSSAADIFHACSLLNFDDIISKLDTSNLKNAANMFDYVNGIKSLDLSSLDFSKIETMTSMFSSCQDLETVILPSLMSGSVKYMGHMFEKCYKLQSVDLSECNTVNVLDMAGLFNSCESLNTITFGDHFVYSTGMANNKYATDTYSGGNPTYRMFYNVPCQTRPNWTGGIWDGGVLGKQGITFAKN